jgi:hypothetical protein
MVLVQPFCPSVPIPVAARAKAWVYGRLFAGFAGSNHSGGMDVCMSRVLCVVRLVTRPEEVVWCLTECDREVSIIVRRSPTWDHRAMGGGGGWYVPLFHCSVYSRFTSTKSPSFCITTCSTSLTNLTVLLPQSRDCSYCVSGRILAPSSL